jgi:hypothetical protein
MDDEQMNLLIERQGELTEKIDNLGWMGPGKQA